LLERWLVVGRMQWYMNLHIHAHTGTYMHIPTPTYTYIHLHSHTHPYTGIHIHTPPYTYIHIHTHTHTYTHIHKKHRSPPLSVMSRGTLWALSGLVMQKGTIEAICNMQCKGFLVNGRHGGRERERERER
jgi:hypothetical protein